MEPSKCWKGSLDFLNVLKHDSFKICSLKVSWGTKKNGSSMELLQKHPFRAFIFKSVAFIDSLIYFSVKMFLIKRKWNCEGPLNCKLLNDTLTPQENMHILTYINHKHSANSHMLKMRLWRSGKAESGILTYSKQTIST